MTETHLPVDGAVHSLLLTTMIESGSPAPLSTLAGRLGVPEGEVEASLRRLEANHGGVLHPGTLEPWVIHPFSTTPTLFYVSRGERGWWAPCIWCALGVAVLVGEPATISTALGGETTPWVLRYAGGEVEDTDLVAHFPIPVAQAWDNVHRHCAATLVFADEAAVEAWCARHGIPGGEVVPVGQVADLAKAWYGRHLDPDWVKPTAAEAQSVFTSVGLTAPHWQVPGGEERF